MMLEKQNRDGECFPHREFVSYAMVALVKIKIKIKIKIHFILHWLFKITKNTS